MEMYFIIYLYVELVEYLLLAQTEEIDILPEHKMYSMSSSTCLVTAKGVYTTRQMAYCRQKLMDFYCDGYTNSIIFRLSKFLIWYQHVLFSILMYFLLCNYRTNTITFVS